MGSCCFHQKKEVTHYCTTMHIYENRRKFTKRGFGYKLEVCEVSLCCTVGFLSAYPGSNWRKDIGSVLCYHYIICAKLAGLVDGIAFATDNYTLYCLFNLQRP